MPSCLVWNPPRPLPRPRAAGALLLGLLLSAESTGPPPPLSTSRPRSKVPGARHRAMTRCRCTLPQRTWRRENQRKTPRWRAVCANRDVGEGAAHARSPRTDVSGARGTTRGGFAPAEKRHTSRAHSDPRQALGACPPAAGPRFALKLDSLRTNADANQVLRRGTAGQSFLAPVQHTPYPPCHSPPRRCRTPARRRRPHRTRRGHGARARRAQVHSEAAPRHTAWSAHARLTW